MSPGSNQGTRNYLTLFATTLIIRSMTLTAFRTRIGWVAILCNGNSLVAATLPHSSKRAVVAALRTQFQCDSPVSEDPFSQCVRERLERYFEGEPVTFEDITFDDSRGTEFQRLVWRLTRAIPYGSIVTYAALARAAGRPHAARAIGQCMARNPVPVVVPCHRVVGSTGELRGFGGGLAMKRALLKMEGAL